MHGFTYTHLRNGAARRAARNTGEPHRRNMRATCRGVCIRQRGAQEGCCRGGDPGGGVDIQRGSASAAYHHCGKYGVMTGLRARTARPRSGSRRSGVRLAGLRVVRSRQPRVGERPFQKRDAALVVASEQSSIEGIELLVEPRVRDGHRGVVGPCGQGGSHEPLRTFVAGCVAPCGEQPIAEHLRRIEVMRLRIDIDACSVVEHLCE